MSHAPIDANVAAVAHKLKARSAVGIAKYGVTTDISPLQAIEWMRHLQEELMDAAVYCEAAIRKLEAAQCR